MPRKPFVAFYAPLKPPDHPNPSGDRHIARLLIQALESAGYAVQLASSFRSLDIKGDTNWQQRLKSVGHKLARRLIRRYRARPQQDRPQYWFTYHLYHKAPDWIGPVVSDALNIPYIVAEASYAPKQADGPWQTGLRASKDALLRADRVICINPVDKACVEKLVPASRVTVLKPFLAPEAFSRPDIDRIRLAIKWGINPDCSWLICVAMMRPGDKLASYKILAQALQKSQSSNVELLIIGDGKEADTVKNLFIKQPSTHFLGKLGATEIRAALTASDLFIWPAVNEALCLSILEAQACSTAVIAGNEGGVASVMADGVSGRLVERRNPEKLAMVLDEFLSHPESITRMGTEARRYADKTHSLDKAADSLKKVLSGISIQ